jgi:hypothetical protein
MIRKIVIYIFFLSTLNGCAQGLAFFGPAFSYSKSGSVVHSALSFGSNQAFQKIRTKSSTNNKENTFDDNKAIDGDYSFLFIKNKIEKSSSIKNLINQ